MQTRTSALIEKADIAFENSNYNLAAHYYQDASSASVTAEEKAHCDFYTVLSEFSEAALNNPADIKHILEKTAGDLENLSEKYSGISANYHYLSGQANYHLADHLASKFTDFSDMSFNIDLLEQALAFLQQATIDYQKFGADLRTNIAFVTDLKNKIHNAMSSLHLQHAQYHFANYDQGNEVFKRRQIERMDVAFEAAKKHMQLGKVSSKHLSKMLDFLKKLAMLDKENLVERKKDIQIFLRQSNVKSLSRKLHRKYAKFAVEENPAELEQRSNRKRKNDAREKPKHATAAKKTLAAKKRRQEKVAETESEYEVDYPPISAPRLNPTLLRTEQPDSAPIAIMPAPVPINTPSKKPDSLFSSSHSFWTTDKPSSSHPTTSNQKEALEALLSLRSLPSKQATIKATPSSSQPAKPQPARRKSILDQTLEELTNHTMVRRQLAQSKTMPQQLQQPQSTGGGVFKQKLNNLLTEHQTPNSHYYNILVAIANFHQRHCDNLRPQHYDIVPTRLFLLEKANILEQSGDLQKYQEGTFFQDFIHTHKNLFANDMTRYGRYVDAYHTLGCENFFWKAIDDYLQRIPAMFPGETQKLYAALFEYIEKNAFTQTASARPSLS